MGSYSYKDLCHSIPEKYTENFEKKYGREFDCDANYDGDYWVIAADYVDDLEKDLAHMKGIVDLCKEAMECNDPINYKLIFGTT